MISAFGGFVPAIAPSAFIAPSAHVIGEVSVGERASVLFGAVLRGDSGRLSISEDSNVQDNCVLHADAGLPVVIGARTSVGHAAVLHGCVVGDECLIGMGAVLLNNVTVGANSLVAAGSLLAEGTIIPPESLVVGAPSRVVRKLTRPEIQEIRNNAVEYVALAQKYLTD